MKAIKSIQEVIRADGKLNSQIIHRKWFTDTDLYKNAKAFAEEHLNCNDATTGELLYIFNNKITSKPVCKGCNGPVKFTMFNKGYRVTCKPWCSRAFKKWKPSNIKQAVDTERDIMVSCFNNKTYTLLSEEKVLQFFSQAYNCKNSNYIIAQRQDMRENKDVLGSLLYYTSFIPVTNSTLNWTERYYCFINKVRPSICESCQQPYQFIGRYVGYRRTCSRGCYVQRHIIPNLLNQGFIIINSEELNNGLSNKKVIVKCVKCQHVEQKIIYNGRWQHVYCPGCYKHMGTSKEEKSLLTFIKENYKGTVLENFNILGTKKEIDIYLPDIRVGIEYDGLYWHRGEDKKNKHLEKTELCIKNNIKLIHVYSNEWIDPIKADICKSVLLSKIGAPTKKYNARDGVVKPATLKEKNDFLEKNHLQGNDKSSVYLGLYINNELVSLVTFGTSRYNKKFQYEIHRFCTMKYSTVRGAFGKLFSYFVKHYKPDTIITYANRRYGEGELYLKCGFNFKGNSSPGYVYTNGADIITRYQAQKHRLKHILADFNPQLSEYDNMSNNNYVRIYDSGNKVYTWKKPEL